MNYMELHVRSFSLADLLLNISHYIVLLAGTVCVCVCVCVCVIVVSARTSLLLNEAHGPSMVAFTRSRVRCFP